MSTSPSFIPYHEPPTPTLLTLTTFLLLLNTTNHLLNSTIYCGLLGQLLLGTAWGTPGAGWLDRDMETAIVQLGYLGLILLVYEGGLNTQVRSVRANFLLSVGVAVTGISAPIALSYVLVVLARVTPLQAFAAGAALCSTSLGTTFTVLSASGLVKTRMGVVLATAAMLDDVVGLVMVQVVSDLGGSARADGGGVGAVVIVRPVLVSLGFAVVVPAVAWGVVRPMTGWIDRMRGRVMVRASGEKGGWARLEVVLRSEAFALSMHTLVLLGLVAGSGYAGTSSLFAAYLAGAVVSWWDSEVAHPHAAAGAGSAGLVSTNSRESGHEVVQTNSRGSVAGTNGTIGRIIRHTESEHMASPPGLQENCEHDTSGTRMFEKYCEPALRRILKPFFFASIGFSIPITQMFRGSIVWRGIIYSLLMFVGKFVCGLWLVRIPELGLSCPGFGLRRPAEANAENQGNGKVKAEENGENRSYHEGENMSPRDLGTTSILRSNGKESHKEAVDDKPSEVAIDHEITTVADNYESKKSLHQDLIRPARSNERRKLKRGSSPISKSSAGHDISQNGKGNEQSKQITDQPHETPSTTKPISLYPSAIVGGAMVARGEIGFLISALAQSTGVFDSPSTRSEGSESEISPIFLIVTWAIMLCTIIGPIVVGVLVRRVKRLETHAKKAGGKERDVFGVWGVE